jgi:hypothetical protein
MADNGPGKGDGGPSDRRCCWSGMEVVDDHPKPTQHMAMHRVAQGLPPSW